MIRRPLLAVLAVAALAGCARNRGELDETGGIAVTRSACPAVAIPAGTGDITLFSPPQSRAQFAVDVVGAITNLKTSCGDQGDDVVSSTSFTVLATRTTTTAAREVVLPYFVTVVRGGSTVVSKEVSSVRLVFPAGAARAQAQATGGATIQRALATLPPEVRAQLTRRRRAGEEDAAIDPLTKPEVRDAVAKASFEVLIGFQLTADQLQYNATR